MNSRLIHRSRLGQEDKSNYALQNSRPLAYGCPWGLYQDDPQHLEKFQGSLSTQTSKLNHVLLFQGMSKAPVHHYFFLLST